MKWLDALLGRTRVPKSRLEQLFALTTAQITLETSFDFRPSGRAGLAFRAVEASSFETAQRELEQLLEIALKESATRSSRRRDQYGFDWVLLEDEQLEDLVAAAHLVGQTMQTHGYGDRLLAALFGFVGPDGRKAYWIYNYKRANFYPFVPLDGQRRDNSLEMRLAAVLRGELPLEEDQSCWYALWGSGV